MSNKRRRANDGNFVRVVSQKRPIDKGLIIVNHSCTTTQNSSGLALATFPCTATGLRWSIAFQGNATLEVWGTWAIVIVRDGLSASTMSLTDEGTMYAPEQDVLAFGVLRSADVDKGAPSVQYIEGSTKSMRKLMGGDAILLITKLNNDTGSIQGCVQMFCKS